MSLLQTIELQTGDAPSASIIVLHGLGADGNDFVPLAQELDLTAVGDVRFIFPQAPTIPVTINGGYVMRAWFDIYSRNYGNRAEDAAWFGVEFARAGMDFLSLSTGGKFEDAKQPKVGQAAYPYTGPSGYECMPTAVSDARGPFGKRRAADIAEAEEENRGGIWSIFAHIVRLRSKGEPTFNLRQAAPRATTAT